MSKTSEAGVLAKELYAARSTTEVVKMVEITTLLFEAAKDKLVDATPAEFEQAQGEAKAYKRLRKMLTEPGFSNITE